MESRPEKVFNPSSPQTASSAVTWVNRARDEERFQENIEMLGRQICIYGETGVGKTSLAFRLLQVSQRSFISYSCDSSSTWQIIIEKVLDSISERKLSGVTSAVGAAGKISGGIWGFLTGEVKTQIQKEWKEQPWSATATKEDLMRVMLNAGLTLVIDDLDRLQDSPSRCLMTDCAKSLSDRADQNPAARMIFIGMGGDVTKLLTFNPSIQARIGLLEVPTMDKEVIKQIFVRGFKALDVFCPNNYVDGLASMCCGLPRTAHMLGYHISKLALKDAREVTPSLLVHGLENTILDMMAEYSTLYRKCVRGTSEKEQVYAQLLRVLAESPKDELTTTQIERALGHMRIVIPRKSVAAHLRELRRIERGAVLQAGVGEGSHRFQNRFFRCYVLMRQTDVPGFKSLTA